MFYDRFRQLCEGKGVTCNKAALEIGLSNATPTKWRKTGAIPTGETLERIAKYFGVSVDELLCNEATSATGIKSSVINSGYWDGHRLREERNLRGYSDIQIASLLEITTEEYTNLENSATEPSFKDMLRLADVFGFDLDYLCHRMMKLDNPSTKFYGSENLLINMYRALDERGQSAVWNTLKHEYATLSGEEANPAPKEA